MEPDIELPIKGRRKMKKRSNNYDLSFRLEEQLPNN